MAPGISDEQQKDRRDLLHRSMPWATACKGDARLAAFYQSEEQAYDMILGDGAKVFDLSQEKDDLRIRYGHPPGARKPSTPLARPVWSPGAWSSAASPTSPSTTPAGIPITTISRPCGPSCRRWTREWPRCCKICPTAACWSSTIVWWSGEFGRTPKIDWAPPWNGGRNHYGQVFSAVLAGGGFKGGCVVGASDAKGEEVKERPVYPCDLLGSIYELMGIDPDGKLPNPMGLDLTVTPSAADGIPMAGRLKEIM